MNIEKIKVIFVDLDGTLLNNENTASERSLNYLMALKERGYHVFICTGRTIEEMKGAFPIPFEPTGMVTTNGMAVYLDGKLVEKNALTKELVNELVDRSREVNMYYELNPIAGKRRIYKEDEQWVRQHVLSGQPASVEDGEFLSRENAMKDGVIDWIEASEHEDIAKIYFYNGDPEEIERFNEGLTALGKVQPFANFSSSLNNIEVIVENISKASGIRYVLNHYHLKPENILVFGDSYNDVPMFELAGNAVAMQNAVPEIKALATDVNPYSNEEDGVYLYLSDLLK
ncbi:HAD family hydrolase [Brochothrix thermosphacta]|uniref:Putative Haloacid dehalogenase-like hydrolase n=1 Tax=Brochothrix thermosphacta TaxID=2756 RepID=A0A2X0QBG3_BROTH|nr:HAD family hydrolase [Brochothrix thermosphacta]SPP25748.1 putative Haloacid dehalogenase-like hydrolase [Brochothrix thermosphacta]